MGLKVFFVPVFVWDSDGIEMWEHLQVVTACRFQSHHAALAELREFSAAISLQMLSPVFPVTKSLVGHRNTRVCRICEPNNR